MDTRSASPLATAALILGLLPLAALIPGMLGFSLTDEVRFGWMIANFAFIIVSFACALVVKLGTDNCGTGAKTLASVSVILDAFWLMLIIGLLALAFMSALQSGRPFFV
ncbi:hypothetical protein VIN30_01975 [Adlercreutzia sp. R7]|uniref:Uncharacterized protein n=1 Tax=Adlercreutzia wanghongyangiae TaxID=3111451 RepID=A0ABU6IFS5_9ACTN|nr:hypothetical protein [Adlercreutzia sp. R7]